MDAYTFRAGPDGTEELPADHMGHWRKRIDDALAVLRKRHPAAALEDLEQAAKATIRAFLRQRRASYSPSHWHHAVSDDRDELAGLAGQVVARAATDRAASPGILGLLADISAAKVRTRPAGAVRPAVEVPT